MSDHTSTLSIEVRTGQAARELENLKVKLAEVAVSARQLGLLTAAPDASGTKASAKSTMDTLETLENSIKKTERAGGTFQHRFSQSMGSVAVGVKVSSKQTVAGLTAIVDAARKSEISIAASFADQSNKMAKLHHQRLDKRAALDKAQEAKIFAENAKAGNQLRALYEAQQQKEQAIAAAGLRRREATRRQQLNLQDKYNMLELRQQIQHLERIEKLLARGASPTRVARRFGMVSLREMENLPAMRQHLGIQSDLNKSTHKGTGIIRDNTAAMRDAHGVARGLSGSLGTLWMTYGSIAPLIAGATIGSMARNTFTVGKDLEYRLKFVEALGNQAIQLDDMMGSVKGSMKTPLEAAEALQALAQAGLDSQQSMAALSSTMQLSTLGELGMQEAVYAMTGSLAAFNLTASETSRVGDVFAKAASMSNTSVSKITGSMKQASSAAAAYNVSIEETSAALVVMAQQNITGTMAGTSYRNMLKELYTPIARGAKALDKLGVSAYDAATKKMRPLSDVLVDLQSKLVGLDAESKNSALEAIFGERGARAIRPILADLERYLETIEEVTGAQGFLAEASAKLIDTVEGATNRMQSTLQQSYSNAFSQINGTVKETILSLDSMFASEGFTKGLALLTEGVARVIKALVDNSTVLSLLAVGYVGMKAAQLTALAGQKAYESSVATLTAWMSRNTVETQMNTSATLGNAAANAQAATATRANASSAAGLAARTVSGAGSVALMVGRMSSLVGWLSVATIAYSALTAIVTTFASAIGISGNRLQTFEGEFRSHIARMNKISEERRDSFYAGQGAGLTNASFSDRQVDELKKYEAHKQDLKSRQDSLQREHDKLQKEVGKIVEVPAGQLVSAEILEANDGAIKSGAMGRLQQIREELKEVEKDVGDVNAAIAEGEKNLKEFAKIKAFDTQTGELQDFVSEQTQTVNALKALMSSAKFATGAQAEYLNSVDLEGMIAQVKGARKQEDLDKLLKAVKVVQDRNDKHLQTVDFSTQPKTPKGPKGPKDYNDPNYILERLNARAKKAELKEEGDIRQALTKVTREQEKADQKRAEQYMTDDMIEGLRARERAEEKFNSILDKRNQLISELEAAKIDATDPAQLALAEERIKAAKAEVQSILEARAAAGSDAFDHGRQKYREDNTAMAGIDKLFTQYQNEAMKTGDIIANSISGAFDTAGQALEQFALTGKLSFRQFTASILQDLSKMAMKMATNQLFSMALQLIGASMLGISGVSSSFAANSMVPVNSMPMGNVSSSYAFAKGAAFNMGEVVANAKGNPYSNGVVNRETLAPMAKFGEAGPEAIMPLTRTSDGSLGVRAVPNGMAQGGGGGNNFYVTTNVQLNTDGSSKEDTSSNNELLAQMGKQFTAQIKQVINKELGQGGSIRGAIKGTS